MKTLIAILAVALLGITPIQAHEQQEHSSGPGLFGYPPEHVHVLLNPMPVYGMMIGVLALAAGLLARSCPAKVLALSIVVVAGASAWPAHYFGENAYQNVRKISDEQGQQWLDEHMGRAEKFLFLFYGTALLGIAGVVSQKKFPKAATPLAVVTLIAGIACAGLGGWISRAGGHIRHSEFRHGAAPPSKGAAHEHEQSKRHNSSKPGHDGLQYDKMQQPDASNGHKHGAEGKQGDEKHSTEKAQLPDTLEGVWKHIHEHHGELETAITGKKFTEVQTHVEHLTALTKRLVELSHPDHKATVESGVRKANQSLTAVRQSAETGSETVAKNNFGAFAKSLNELEQQMKKQ